MKRLTIVLAIILLLFLLSEWLIPPLVTQYLTDFLYDSLEGIEELKIELKAFPSIYLLLGHAKELYLQGEGVIIQGLTIHSFESRFEGLRFPPVWRWWGDEWTIIGENTSLAAYITEEELNDYLASSFDDLFLLNLSLHEEGVYLTTTFEVYNMVLEAKLEGHFQVTGPQRIDFVPTDISIEDFRLPEVMLTYFMEELRFYLDLREIPLPLHVTDVITMEGVVFFRGDGR